MALIACHECSSAVSTEAATCPKCGAPVVSPSTRPAATKAKPSAIVRWGGGFILLCIIVPAVVALLLPNEHHDSAPPAATAAAISLPPAKPTPATAPKTEPVKVDFDQPLVTGPGTLVCPASAVMDNREGHGVLAAMKTRGQVFDRREDAEKAGCEEWREGMPITLVGGAAQTAKQWQAEHSCGMLLFTEGVVFSCELRNAAHEPSAPVSRSS